MMASIAPDDTAIEVVGGVDALRSLGRRHQQLTAEINELDELLEPLVTAINPALVTVAGVGADNAGQLLVTAGENHQRLTSEAAFAMLCGAAPLPASSGKTARHRLNRGGDRQANAALFRIVLVRMRWDPRTRAYVERRTKDGLFKKKSSAALNATSPARSTNSSPRTSHNPPLDIYRSVLRCLDFAIFVGAQVDRRALQGALDLVRAQRGVLSAEAIWGLRRPRHR
jgi:hypothetical protein